MIRRCFHCYIEFENEIDVLDLCDLCEGSSWMAVIKIRGAAPWKRDPPLPEGTLDNMEMKKSKDDTDCKEERKSTEFTDEKNLRKGPPINLLAVALQKSCLSQAGPV